MVNFHENKLWQESYVVLMDLHEAFEETSASGHDENIIKDFLETAQKVASIVADSLTRRDGRIARELLNSAVARVAETRTHLAVAWGRGLVDDDTFKSLDDKYAHLSESLQK